MATVSLLVYSIILGLCYHSLGGIILFHASFIETVHPSLVVIYGLWYHYLEGIMPFHAKVRATV